MSYVYVDRSVCIVEKSGHISHRDYVIFVGGKLGRYRSGFFDL